MNNFELLKASYPDTSVISIEKCRHLSWILINFIQVINVLAKKWHTILRIVFMIFFCSNNLHVIRDDSMNEHSPHFKLAILSMSELKYKKEMVQLSLIWPNFKWIQLMSSMLMTSCQNYRLARNKKKCKC